MDITEQQIEQLLASRPQSLDELTGRITPAIHAQLKSAVELRRWSDGERLSPDQLENCLQLVILYEAAQLPEDQRTGFALPVNCHGQTAKSSAAAPLTFRGEGQDG